MRTRCFYRDARPLVLEALEDRCLLSVDPWQGFDPTPLEQEMLEHVNRFRLDPQGELGALFTSLDPLVARDPDAELAVATYNDPTTEEILSDWSAFLPVEPLAWNPILYGAALGHTELMIQYDQQLHQLPGELPLGERLLAAGYDGNQAGENIFAYMNSVFHGHSAFAINWAVPSRSHRMNLMAPEFREAGIAILPDDSDLTDVGPLVVTQDFGDGAAMVQPNLLGVVYDDVNENGWFDALEGFQGVEIRVEGTGGSFFTTSMSAGGYQVQVPPGVYTVTAYGGTLPSPMLVADVVVGDANVKVDFEYSFPPELAIDDLWLEETPNGATSFSVHVRLSEPAEHPVTVELATADGTARAGLDYVARQMTVTFSPGQTHQTVPLLVVDDEQIELEEGFLVTLANAYGATIVDAQATATITDDDAATKLGVTAFRRLDSLHPWWDDFLFRMETTRDGLLSLEARANDPGGEVEITLYNRFRNEVLASAASIGGVARIDFPTDEGISYYVQLSGTGENVDLLLGNLVEQAGQTLTVHGTEGDDHFEFDAFPTRHVVVNGLAYDFSPNDVTLVTFDAGEGNDTAALTGSPESDSARIRPFSTSLLGSDYEVQAAAVSSVIVRGGGGLEDVAHLYDSVGDDVFTARPTDAEMVGTGFFNRVMDFDFAHGYATAGGRDTARLLDSPGDDEFVGRATYGKMFGDGFYNRAKLFEEVVAEASLGSDSASLYDSAGDDVFNASAAEGGLAGDGFSNHAVGFDYLHGYARYGGNDVATLVDSAGDDTFVATPAYGKLFGPGYLVRAKFFPVVHVVGTGLGYDAARFYDGPGDDVFELRPTAAKFSGDGFARELEGFDWVRAYSDAGGHDVASLYDTAGDDTFIAGPEDATLSGEDFVVRAARFEAVHAYSIYGGSDTAWLQDSAGDDTLISKPDYSKLSGPGYFLRAKFFDHVIASSVAGGRDTANLVGSPGNDLFVGRTNSSEMSGEGFSYWVEGFEEVFARAGSGDDDVAQLFGSGDPGDQFTSGEDWGWLENDALDFLIVANFFDWIQWNPG